MKILVVESEISDIFLLQEALSEMAEEPYWRVWRKEPRPVFVDRLDAATRLLREERFDAILLDLDLPDGGGLHTYLRVRAEAPSTPVVVLVADREEELAGVSVREGAQDYLLKSELDCGPLARAIHHAIERQQMMESLRRLSFLDETTGLYNSSGFRTLASRDMSLARRSDAGLALFVFELEQARAEGPLETGSESRRDLALLETAEVLRTAFDDDLDLLARLGGERFAVMSFQTGAAVDARTRFQEQVRSHNARLSRRCRLSVACGHAHLSTGRYESFDELLEAAEASLCNNKWDRMMEPESDSEFVPD